MAERKSIYVDGMLHGSTPIPSASKVGPFFASSIVRGFGSDGKIPSSVEQEAANLMDNVEKVLLAAGGSLENIVKISIYVRDRSVRDALNPVWEKAFPDPESRPARHVGIGDIAMADSHFEAEVFAYIE